MWEESSSKGYWSLLCDSETVSSRCSTGIKTMLETLSKLPEILPELFPIPPNSMKFKEKDKAMKFKVTYYLLIFTSANSDEEIEKSAEAIRSNADFPFIMYYLKKKVPDSKDPRLGYMHTPDGELYKFSIKDNSAGCFWTLISKKAEVRLPSPKEVLKQIELMPPSKLRLDTTPGKKTKPTDAFDELLPSQVTDRNHIHLPVNEEDFEKAINGKGEKWIAHCPDWKKLGGKTKPTDAFEELLPSQVTDRDLIHLPANEEDFERARNVKAGKWIMQCSDWKTLDNLWENLICLYDSGVLVGLKSYTAKGTIKEIAPEYKTQAIKCYTADADCKASVRRAAQSIFICTGYDFIMYYKSNKASRNGLYRHEGHGRVAKYMFTSGGEMFEKDYLKRWKKIDFNEQKLK